MSRLLLLALLLAQTACSTGTLIRDRAYEDAVNAYRRGEPAAALEKFPQGEEGGLITSIEKSWLNMWHAHWDPAPLQKQVDTFDDRRFISVSREAGIFLLSEAEEGYVPSEHEVIVLHLLSATHFIKVNKTEDAAVELRRAGYVLDRFWDDSALRLWLGTLWAGMGRWDEALVDFRRSQELNPSEDLARILRGPEPRALTLNFYGVGPDIHWKAGEYTPDFLQVSDEPAHVSIRASTLHWFKRHEKRNSELRDVLVKSNFMAQYLGSKAMTETERGVNKTAVWSIRATIIAVTTAVIAGTIYLFAQSGANSGDVIAPLVGGEFGVGAAAWTASENLDRRLDLSLANNEARKNESLRIYRVARFMPGWITLEASNREQLALQDSSDHVILGNPAHQVLLVNHY